MRKLLNTLICILLTSPLAAFDIALDGVEFGKLQMTTTESTWILSAQETAELVSEAVILNQGDVLQILRNSPDDYITIPYTSNQGYSSNAYPYSTVYATSGDIVSNTRAGFIVGPASVQVGFKLYNSSNINSDRVLTYTTDNNLYAELDYAILRAGASTQSSYVTIPANSSGNFEVKLQTSSDLQTWSPTTPGIFPYGDNAKFFRLVVE